MMLADSGIGIIQNLEKCSLSGVISARIEIGGFVNVGKETCKENTLKNF